MEIILDHRRAKNGPAGIAEANTVAIDVQGTDARTAIVNTVPCTGRFSGRSLQTRLRVNWNPERKDIPSNPQMKEGNVASLPIAYSGREDVMSSSRASEYALKLVKAFIAISGGETNVASLPIAYSGREDVMSSSRLSGYALKLV